MTLVDENVFPKLILQEAAAPSSPAATQFKLYVDSSDHLLKYKNSAGVATILGAGVADQGVITYLDGTVAAAPGTPAAGKLRLYAKTGKVLAVKDDAGVETVLGAGGGGGSDLVQTASGAGSVYVPGLRGSPDRIPTSPSAFDDEFTALSGWTTLGTLDTSNVTDFPSHWHVKRTNGALGLDGIYKTAPSMPFTVTAKLNASNLPQFSAGTASGANYHTAAILLTEASPGKCLTFGFTVNAAVIYTTLYRWTTRASFATNVDASTGVSSLTAPTNTWPYIRLVVASSTDVSGFISRDGFLWFPTVGQQNLTTNLTVANVGLAICDPGSGSTIEAVFDWIRFT